MRTERELRLYAQHLALIVSHRTLRSLERGIVRYHDQEMIKMGVKL